MELNKKNVKYILGIIFFGIILFTLLQNIGSVLDFVSRIFTLISPVVTGLCMAFVLNVLLRVMETYIFSFLGRSKRKWIARLQRPVSLTVTILLALGILSLLLLVIIPELRVTILTLIDNIPTYWESARTWLENFLLSFNINADFLENTYIDWEKVSEMASGLLSPSADNIVETAADITSSVIRFFSDTVFGLFIAIYVLAQKERIGRFMHRLLAAIFSQKVAQKVLHIAATANRSFSNFITGQLTESIILGVLCFIMMTIFRFPNGAVISILIAITSLVPVIGPLVGEIIGCLLILMVSPLKALLFLVFILTLQMIEGNLIYPKVVGKSVGLPSIIVLIAVIVGGNLGGILGALLGVPVASFLYTLVREWMEHKQHSPPRTPRPQSDKTEAELPNE
jgi:predicted PurR-regulated permease PerM